MVLESSLVIWPYHFSFLFFTVNWVEGITWATGRSWLLKWLRFRIPARPSLTMHVILVDNVKHCVQTYSNQVNIEPNYYKCVKHHIESIFIFQSYRWATELNVSWSKRTISPNTAARSSEETLYPSPDPIHHQQLYKTTCNHTLIGRIIKRRIYRTLCKIWTGSKNCISELWSPKALQHNLQSHTDWSHYKQEKYRTLCKIWTDSRNCISELWDSYILK